VNPNDWIAVGRLWRARGVRGELIGEIYSSQPGREESLKEVMLDLEGRRQQATVEQVWRHDGRPVFKFAGIDTMTAAEAWQGADILVRAEERAGPAEGEYSHADLIGCRVIAGPDAVVVGVVTGVEDYGGPSLLKVEAADGHEILIPFARAICTEIDVAAKTIRAILPEGLVEVQ